MKNFSIKLFILVMFLGNYAFAQNENPIVRIPGFNPQMSGFGFKNYGNDASHNWKDDLGAEDLIRLIGAKGACKIGESAQDCVLDATAQKWLEEWLKVIDKGRCTGMAVASLRFQSRLGFKTNNFSQLLNGSKSTFNISPNQTIENYIAYYWLTQVFDEVKKPKNETAKKGPVEIAKILTRAIETGEEFYTMSIKKYERGRIFDGHEFTPFAIEESATQYKIHIYDNNFPGETRYLFINKDGSQYWSYSAEKIQKTKGDYFGDKNTNTLSITASSWREGKCFKPAFVNDNGIKIGCGVQARNSAIRSTRPIKVAQNAEFFLTGEGEMLITDGNGKRIGYDQQSDTFYDDFSDGDYDIVLGGLGFDVPHFTLPYQNDGEFYTIMFSGKYLNQESEMDFVFSAPNFTVGFEGIKLDKNEILKAIVSSDGQIITFIASSDSETPNVFYAFDSIEDKNAGENENTGKDENASFSAEIGGIELSAGKSLTYNFDFENGKLFFGDNDGNEDAYNIEFTRLNGDGTKQNYAKNNLDIGKIDKYEMNFGDWNGDETMCFKDDEDGDNVDEFDDFPCDEQKNEDPKDD
jgi:hypothetical protein